MRSSPSRPKTSEDTGGECILQFSESPPISSFFFFFFFLFPSLLPFPRSGSRCAWGALSPWWGRWARRGGGGGGRARCGALLATSAVGVRSLYCLSGPPLWACVTGGWAVPAVGPGVCTRLVGTGAPPRAAGVGGVVAGSGHCGVPLLPVRLLPRARGRYTVASAPCVRRVPRASSLSAPAPVRALLVRTRARSPWRAPRCALLLLRPLPPLPLSPLSLSPPLPPPPLPPSPPPPPSQIPADHGGIRVIESSTMRGA